MSVLPKLDSLSGNSLRRLHRKVVSDPAEIVRLLLAAKSAGEVLNSGVDRKSEPRIARILQVDSQGLLLDAPNISASGQPQVYLRFDLDRTNYFFAAPPIAGGAGVPLQLAMPVALYESERRELLRTSAGPPSKAPKVKILVEGQPPLEARLRDWSYQGMSVSMPNRVASKLSSGFEVEIIEGEHQGERRFASLRRSSDDEEVPGWTRIGVEASQIPLGSPFPVVRRSRILHGGAARNAWRKISLATAVAKRVPARAVLKPATPDLELVSYTNAGGQPIAGLVDRAVGGVGGTAVVVPPAWGRTKETFLPLARTLVSTFERSGHPISVLRYDGTNRRGESYIAPECREPGDEYLRYRFSQGVEDVRASLDFARSAFKPKHVVLVSFSLGAVEARRAATLEAPGDLDGWVSVVGMVDLQSGLRTVSGGVDFAYGQSMGVSFGKHELVGVVADMDFTGQDAFENNLVFLEDAKRDMAKLEIPVTWIHGKFDAWMDLQRVQSAMSAGASDSRKLIEVPAGHQMRSSTEALETFQLVSAEVSRMALGNQLEPELPDLADLEARTAAEKKRRPKPDLDRSGFWKDYLLGRDRRLGFELMSATSPYRSLMTTQIERLCLQPGQHVLDCGSGTGDFSVVLAERGAPEGLRVTNLDLVPDALKRSKERLGRFSSLGFSMSRLAADLEIENTTIPLSRGSVDAILASLMISYVENAPKLLREMYSTIRPGGLLVMSSMRRDADISRIYVNSIAELPPDRRAKHFGKSSADDFEELQRVFLNDAAKLMQLEEDGEFKFYDLEELASIVEEAGFKVVSMDRAFGDPAQAVVVTARRA